MADINDSIAKDLNNYKFIKVLKFLVNKYFMNEIRLKVYKLIKQDMTYHCNNYLNPLRLNHLYRPFLRL